jgi:hypothetical protein
MSTKLLHLARIAFKNEAGQILPWIAVAFVAAIGVTGLALDLGHAYIVQSQLQMGANAAALAGAQVLPADPSNQALQYSGWQAGDNNYSSAIGTLNKPIVTGKCLTTTKIPCLNPTGWNAVQVTQSVSVPTMFMRALDFLPGVHLDTVPVSATATAGRSKPYPINVAIIVDMTGSLDVPEQNDPDCSSSNQEFQCQLYAVQAMLKALEPCSDGSLGSNCTPDKADVRIGLFMFPNISADSTTLGNEVCGSGAESFPQQSNGTNNASNPDAITNITPEPYTFPSPSATNYTTAGLTYNYTPKSPSTVTTMSATYQVIPFSSDYYDNTQTYGLNPSSNLVKAIGQGNGAIQGCLNFPSGIVNTGIGNTYLASSIYAAQAALLGVQAQYSTRKSTNYMIFISDGQSNVIAGSGNVDNQMATVSGGSMRATTAPTTLNGQPQPAPGVWPLFTSFSGGGITTLTGNGLYPDTADQCQQAIMAGAAATATGTVVNAVANGSATGSGCGYAAWNGYKETSLVAKGTYNVSFSSYSTLDSCTTMKDIASTIETFYSTTTQNCVDPNTNHGGASTLEAIFKNMSFGLVRAILIPNSTT